MKNNKLITDYEITTDSDFLNIQNSLTPDLKRQIAKYHQMALEGKKYSIPKLLAAIEKYPDNPQLKNYLSVLYSNTDNEQKANEANRWIVAEHPDYLFGKLNLAYEYFEKEEYYKIPEILGSDMEIKSLYPNRDKFHLNEVTSFFKVAILYYAALGELEQAEIRFELLKKLAPESVDVSTSFRHIASARLKAAAERMEEEDKLRIEVKGKKQEKTKTTLAPKFIHKEIEQLYRNDLHIEKEILDGILSLPQESLIKDLESVIDDSIERFGYFDKLWENDEWEEGTTSFVIHAIFFLGELKEYNSLDAIFKVFSQSDEYLDIYLSDFLTDGVWEPVYKITDKQLDKHFQFMCRPGINTYSKSVISDVIEQIAHHQPERRAEVIDWFKNVINCFLNGNLDDNIIDSDVIALMICNIIDIEAKELLPEIKELFENHFVSVGICGVCSAVEKAFLKPSSYSKKKELLSITSRYEKITSGRASYRADPGTTERSKDDYVGQSITSVRVESKIGRNDPCPCGSGKKYKKCCINKD